MDLVVVMDWLMRKVGVVGNWMAELVLNVLLCSDISYIF